jgi:pilus assembly protein CpaE
MATIAIITPIGDGDERVAAAADGTPTVVHIWREEYLRVDPTKIVDDTAEAGASVACIGPGIDMDAALVVAEAFDRHRPEVCVILVAEPSPTQWQDALRAGVRDVVSPTAERGELAAAIRRAVQTAAARQRTAPPVDDLRSSKTVAVLSPKGGSGKSTMATNLAAGIAKRGTASVAIVDLDLQFGDVAPYLQLLPESSLADVARATESVDATMLKVFLTRHATGLYALCGPESPGEAEEVGYDVALQAVRLLAGEFDRVIVDTPPDLGESTLAAVEAATDLLFVCSTDVSTIRSLRKELDALDRLGLTGQRRHLVLNRADAQVGVRVADIEELLGLRVAVEIPSSRTVPTAINQGVPVIEAYPKTPVARQLEKVVDLFVDDVAAGASTSERRSWRKGRS